MLGLSTPQCQWSVINVPKLCSLPKLHVYGIGRCVHTELSSQCMHYAVRQQFPGGIVVAIIYILLVAGITNAHKGMHINLRCRGCYCVAVSHQLRVSSLPSVERRHREDRKCPGVFDGGSGCFQHKIFVRGHVSRVVCGVVYHVDLPPCGQCYHMHILAASKHRS
jgi:hypothetical protein